MSDRISEWKQAKELCDQTVDLSTGDRIHYINNADVTDTIKTKALNLLEKMDSQLGEINVEKFFDKSTQKVNLPGKFIDGYKLISLLGSGGMSSVYLAERVKSEVQKKVALKILSPYVSDDKYLELFNREQKSLSQLNHNNIVSFHHGGQADDGTKYLIMDYVEDGIDILKYVKDNDLDQKACLKLINTITQAMDYAHSKGIIHRDLKSANILVDTNGDVKIVDFGISLFAENQQTISSESTRCFTLDIASPEQIQGKKVDERTDIFSLGALLLQMLTDKTPLPKVNMVAYQPIDDKRHVASILSGSNLSRDIKNIITTAMHIDLNQRYAEMKSFTEDLENYLNHKPIIATNDTLSYRFRKFLQRNAVVSGLTMAVLLVTFGAYLLVNNFYFDSQESEQKNNRSMAIIDALFEQADPFKSKKNTAELIATLEAIRASQKQALESDPEFKYHFYNKMGEIYESSSNYEHALEAKNNALESLSQFAFTDDEKYLRLESQIIHLVNELGNHHKSKRLAERFLTKVESIKDSLPEFKLEAYLLLCQSHLPLSYLDKALKACKSAQNHLLKNPEIGKKSQAALYNTLAVVHRNTGNMESAGINYEKAIANLKGIENEEKLLATMLNNYAVFMGRSGDFESSEALFKESIELVKSIDPKHPYVGVFNLAYSTLLNETNRWDEAEMVLIEAIELFKSANLNVELSQVYSRLTMFALRRFDLTKAIHYLVLNIKDVKRRFPMDHPNVLSHYNLSLSFLMLDPYQNHARDIVNYLQYQNEALGLKNSAYPQYQFFQGLLNKDVNSESAGFNILLTYLFEVSILSNKHRLDWLNEKIAQQDSISRYFHPFLHVWKLELKFNKAEYRRYCVDNVSWLRSPGLVMKAGLLNDCLNIAKMNKIVPSVQLLEAKEKLDFEIEKNKNNLNELVQLLTE